MKESITEFYQLTKIYIYFLSYFSFSFYFSFFVFFSSFFSKRNKEKRKEKKERSYLLSAIRLHVKRTKGNSKKFWKGCQHDLSKEKIRRNRLRLFLCCPTFYSFPVQRRQDITFERLSSFVEITKE